MIKWIEEYYLRIYFLMVAIIGIETAMSVVTISHMPKYANLHALSFIGGFFFVWIFTSVLLVGPAWLITKISPRFKGEITVIAIILFLYFTFFM